MKSRPFRAWRGVGFFPRALPWAITWRPVGAGAQDGTGAPTRPEWPQHGKRRKPRATSWEWRPPINPARKGEAWTNPTHNAPLGWGWQPRLLGRCPGYCITLRWGRATWASSTAGLKVTTNTPKLRAFWRNGVVLDIGGLELLGHALLHAAHSLSRLEQPRMRRVANR